MTPIAVTIRTEEDLLRVGLNSLTGISPTVLTYINVHVLHLSHQKPELEEALLNANHVYCDSDGIRLFFRLRKGHRIQKLTGAGFVHTFLNHLGSRSPSLFLLGGRPGSPDLALQRLRKSHPRLRFVGSHHGFYSKDEEPRILQQIEDSNPDVLVLGLGTPRQELFAYRNREHLSCKLIWSVGSLIEFLARRESRAPTWMLQVSLEWLFRTLTHPLGHFPRVFWEIPLFIYRALSPRWNQVTLSERPSQKESRSKSTLASG